MQEQENIKTTEEKVKTMLGKMPNWKTPGPDLAQGFWLKSFRSLHERLREQLNKCLNEGNVPDWMTKGRTVLIMKNKDGGNGADNFRPITCFPLVWKLLTGIITEEMYSFLGREELLPEEQKGCRKQSQGTMISSS